MYLQQFQNIWHVAVVYGLTIELGFYFPLTHNFSSFCASYVLQCNIIDALHHSCRQTDSLSYPTHLNLDGTDFIN